MQIDSEAVLNNGVRMPYLGFGTWDLRGESGKEAIQYALEIGYRHIDTAQGYDNELQVGQALKESGVPRESVFITTKVTNTQQGYQTTLASLDESLRKLQTDYVDLFLIHWPDVENFDRSIASWRALIDLQTQGKARAIGVSNYTIPMIEKTIEVTKVIPAVNQVEFHPFLFQKDLLDCCKKTGIQIESYSPIARARHSDHPVLQALAQKYDKLPEQIILAWHLAHQLIAIPRSSNPAHIKANADIFDFSLTPEDVAKMDQLNLDHRLIHPANAPKAWSKGN